MLTGGLDRQASDLLFGGPGDDTFQLLPDYLPYVKGTYETSIPSTVDRFDGAEGDVVCCSGAGTSIVWDVPCRMMSPSCTTPHFIVMSLPAWSGTSIISSLSLT